MQLRQFAAKVRGNILTPEILLHILGHSPYPLVGVSTRSCNVPPIEVNSYAGW